MKNKYTIHDNETNYVYEWGRHHFWIAVIVLLAAGFVIGCIIGCG